MRMKQWLVMLVAFILCHSLLAKEIVLGVDLLPVRKFRRDLYADSSA